MATNDIPNSLIEVIRYFSEVDVHDLLPVHPDQPIGAQPVQGRVQRPGAQPDPATGNLLNVGDDPVPVLAAIGQRGQDLGTSPPAWPAQSYLLYILLD